MGRRKAIDPDSVPKRVQPVAIDPEAREKQLIALAVDCAEQQMRNGTASAQVICHYLKLGSSVHQLELEKMERENELLRAKVESLESSKRVEELYSDAIEAMRRYSGSGKTEEQDDG